MPKRVLNIDWRSLNGACQKKRILRLASNVDGVYVCPVSNCLQIGYKSQRGLRKHITSIHEWYYYFDEQPKISRTDASDGLRAKLKCTTSKLPAFTLEKGLGEEFFQWLQSPCGGGKHKKDALQVGRRAMKFLKKCMGETDEDVVTEGYADCCLSSLAIIISFMKVIMEDWNMSSSGALNYMKAIEDLMDFRKSCGISDEILRSFAVSEVYVRRGKINLFKRKQFEYSRNLQLEKLIARNSWASVEEMEEVIPYHTLAYQDILKLCKQERTTMTVSQLAFATRFIVTFLFLRVKCTRPMSYQYLTVQMLESAKENGGYVDQTAFKTHDKYTFDTLILDEPVIDILDGYKRYVRPLCHPVCDYLIVTTNGTQYTAFCTAMSILVHEAIGKIVNPTRYRQIVETESSERLSPEEREIISKDQKHSSYVAKRVYQKKLSRDIALSGKKCMAKIVGTNRDKDNVTLASVLKDAGDNEAGPSTETVCSLSCDDFRQDSPAIENIITVSEVCNNGNTRSHGQNPENDGDDVSPLSVFSPLNMDVEIKREEAAAQVTGEVQKRFTPEEDMCIRMGIKKYGSSNWSKILRDSEYRFASNRNRDSLRMRARTLKLIKKSRKRKSPT